MAGFTPTRDRLVMGRARYRRRYVMQTARCTVLHRAATLMTVNTPVRTKTGRPVARI